MRTISIWTIICWLIATKGALCQEEELRARVDQLEKQVRQLTSEVILLRQSLRSQQKITEEMAGENARRQDILYDEIIAAYREAPAENTLYSFYRHLIHSHVWLGGYLELKVQNTESREDPDLFDLSGAALTFRASLHEDLSVHGEIAFSEETVRVTQGYLLVSLSPLASVKGGGDSSPLGQIQWFLPASGRAPGVAPAGRRIRGSGDLERAGDFCFRAHGCRAVSFRL